MPIQELPRLLRNLSGWLPVEFTDESNATQIEETLARLDADINSEFDSADSVQRIFIEAEARLITGNST